LPTNICISLIPCITILRDHNTVFGGLIATDCARVAVRWHNQPELAERRVGFRQLFGVLGVQAALGRLLVPYDDLAQEASPVAVSRSPLSRRSMFAFLCEFSMRSSQAAARANAGEFITRDWSMLSEKLRS
jgi:hypothetical protein